MSGGNGVGSLGCSTLFNAMYGYGSRPRLPTGAVGAANPAVGVVVSAGVPVSYNRPLAMPRPRNGRLPHSNLGESGRHSRSPHGRSSKCRSAIGGGTCVRRSNGTSRPCLRSKSARQRSSECVRFKAGALKLPLAPRLAALSGNLPLGTPLPKTRCAKSKLSLRHGSGLRIS